jgi:hypothetical protein
LGFRLSRFFTPLDFKYPDARSCEMTHLDRQRDFLLTISSTCCSTGTFPFFMDLLPYDRGPNS